MTPNDSVVGNPLVVCTAHIHWDPEFCDVKLIQSMILVQEIATLLDEVQHTIDLDFLESGSGRFRQTAVSKRAFQKQSSQTTKAICKIFRSRQ